MNDSIQASPPGDFDRGLIEEAAYEVALAALLEGLEQGDRTAYDRIARNYPRYAAPLLEAALIALPAPPQTLIRETAAPYTLAPAVEAGIASARRTLGLPDPSLPPDP